MKPGWESKPLSEVANLAGRIGWKGLTAKEYTASGPLFLSVHSLNYGDVVDYRDAFHISQERYDESPEIMLREHDILICKDGAGIGKVGIIKSLPNQATINSSLLLVRAKPGVEPFFLYHALTSPSFQAIVKSRLEGATTPHLYQRDIANFPITLPPLAEQRRVVATLDETLTGIATATTNTEKKMANTCELFDSFVDAFFSTRDAGWMETRLGQVCTLQRGFDLPTHQRRKGSVPLVSSSGIIDSVDDAKVHGPGVITGRSGSIGNVFKVEKDFWPLNTTLYVKNFHGNDVDFVFRLLKKFDLSKYASGTGVPTLNRNFVHDEAVRIPSSIEEQRRVAKEITSMEAHINGLCAVYDRQLTALTELKKSLLQKAFAGELH